MSKKIIVKTVKEDLKSVKPGAPVTLITLDHGQNVPFDGTYWLKSRLIVFV